MKHDIKSKILSHKRCWSSDKAIADLNSIKMAYMLRQTHTHTHMCVTENVPRGLEQLEKKKLVKQQKIRARMKIVSELNCKCYDNTQKISF